MTPYERLRPDTNIEYCDCEQVTRILLVYVLSVNPIHCYECKGTIDPEKIELSNERTRNIDNWHSVFRSLYSLWLDSGEYEKLAKQSLLNPDGEVNVKGARIAKDLSKNISTYYWWFHDSDDDDLTNCPNCDDALDHDEN